MPVFTHTFSVRAPLEVVAAFHRDTRILQKLTPPPVWVELHRVEPLAEGSVSEFTLWLGPCPIRWVALHSQVHPQYGFTDTQQTGPFQAWRHTHTFTAEASQRTRIQERVEYVYFSGWRGIWTRLLFNPLALWFVFLYRQLLTQRSVERV